MSVHLPLGEMSVEEKIEAMESLWDDLCLSAADMPSPNWHAECLAERETRQAAGQEAPEDWESAKRSIRESIS